MILKLKLHSAPAFTTTSIGKKQKRLNCNLRGQPLTTAHTYIQYMHIELDWNKETYSSPPPPDMYWYNYIPQITIWDHKPSRVQWETKICIVSTWWDDAEVEYGRCQAFTNSYLHRGWTEVKFSSLWPFTSSEWKTFNAPG